MPTRQGKKPEDISALHLDPLKSQTPQLSLLVLGWSRHGRMHVTASPIMQVVGEAAPGEFWGLHLGLFRKKVAQYCD